MANILLFNPPGPRNRGWTREGRCTQPSGVWGTQWPPVTLATAAAMLSTEGHRVRAVDFPALGQGEGDLVCQLVDFRPQFAIWNTGTPTLFHDLGMGSVVKKWAPQAVTAVMGTHVTAEPHVILSAPGVDLAIRGEPEPVIQALCRRHRGDWPQTAGISYRSRETGTLVDNPTADVMAPEAIPSPAWHLLELDAYRLPLKGRRFLIVAPVRGCPYACSFCTAPIYYGRQLRKRPVEKVADEIEANIRHHGIRNVFIWADTFTAHRRYVLDFCRILRKRRLDISWTCNSRVDTVDRHMLQAMKEAGLWMISYGLESGDEAVLAGCRKNITPTQSRQAVRLSSELGIRISGHFIFGLPGETRHSMRRTLDFALELPLDIAQFYTAAAFPGTALREDAVRHGWLAATGSESQSRAGIDLPGLKAAEVDAFRKVAYRKFYLRASAVRRLVQMAEPGAVRSVVGTIKGFLRWANG